MASYQWNNARFFFCSYHCVCFTSSSLQTYCQQIPTNDIIRDIIKTVQFTINGSPVKRTSHQLYINPVPLHIAVVTLGKQTRGGLNLKSQPATRRLQLIQKHVHQFGIGQALDWLHVKVKEVEKWKGEGEGEKGATRLNPLTPRSNLLFSLLSTIQFL